MKILFLAMMVALAGVSPGMADTASLLHYRWSGGHSPLASTEVEISATGETVVTIKRLQGEPNTYQTTLSAEELGILNSLIDTCRVFFLTADWPQGRPSVGGGGVTELEVTRGDKTKSLRFVHEDSLGPLLQFQGKLILQAEAIHTIQTDGDVSYAFSILAAPPHPPQVLQQAKFKDPVLTYIATTKDRQRLQWSLAALATLTEPGEYLDLVSREASKAERAKLVLGAIPGSLPVAHEEALCRLYLDCLVAHDSKPGLSEEQSSVVESFADRLGERHHRPAVAFFVARLEKATKEHPGGNARVAPLATMGADALHALLPFLDSKDEVQRGYTIELLATMARMNPVNHYSNLYSAEEYATILPLLRDRVLPRLVVITENDPSRFVKREADKALKEISEEIAK